MRAPGRQGMRLSTSAPLDDRFSDHDRRPRTQARVVLEAERGGVAAWRRAAFGAAQTGCHCASPGT